MLKLLVERFYSFFKLLFMRVLGFVILLYSYRGMMSVPTVKIKTRLIIANCDRTVITKSIALPIPSYSNLSTKMAATLDFNFNECN